MDLFDFTSFFGLDFYKYSGSLYRMNWSDFLKACFIPISSAVEPKRLRPGFGDSEPLEDFPVGDEPFSKFFRSPPESSCKKGKKTPEF